MMVYVYVKNENMVKLLKAEFDIFALRKSFTKGSTGGLRGATNANPVSDTFEQKYQA